MWLATCSVSCDVCVSATKREERHSKVTCTQPTEACAEGWAWSCSTLRKQVTNSSGHWAHLLADQQAAAAPVRQARWQDTQPHGKWVCHPTKLECLTGTPSHLHCLGVLDVGHNVDRLLLLAVGCHELLNLHEVGQHLGICLFAGDAWHAACRVSCQQLRSISCL